MRRYSSSSYSLWSSLLLLLQVLNYGAVCCYSCRYSITELFPATLAGTQLRSCLLLLLQVLNYGAVCCYSCWTPLWSRLLLLVQVLHYIDVCCYSCWYFIIEHYAATIEGTLLWSCFLLFLQVNLNIVVFWCSFIEQNCLVF